MVLATLATMHPNLVYSETCMFEFTVTKARGSKIDRRMHSASQFSTAFLLTYYSQQHMHISSSCRVITFINFDSYPGLFALVLQLGSR